MDQPVGLVDHFFRHEYGRLVALLTRSFGVHNLELAEDAVQSAIAMALVSWRKTGVPNEPSAWLFRTASNLAIDVLRRQKRESSTEVDFANEISNWEKVGVEEVGDEPLRMLFLCCNPEVPLDSRIAFALKTIGGFGIAEIASALLISPANAEKRVTRAKEKLREVGEELFQLNAMGIAKRLDAVRSTIYLVFSEGFTSSSGSQNLRQDICQEAIRLVRMLVRYCENDPEPTAALLALMLMHSARFDSRIDTYGAIVLLEDQDRSKWNWQLIREAMDWMTNCAKGKLLSRFHIESAIAWEHCRAKAFEETDWDTIASLYEVLYRDFPGPMVALNRAIAIGYSLGPQEGLQSLASIVAQDRSKIRPWWDCAMADAYRRQGMVAEAISHWQDALSLASNSQQRDLIERRIQSIRSQSL